MKPKKERKARVKTVLLLVVLGLCAAGATLPTAEALPVPGDGAGPYKAAGGNECAEPIWHFSGICILNPINSY